MVFNPAGAETRIFRATYANTMVTEVLLPKFFIYHNMHNSFCVALGAVIGRWM